MCKRWRYVDSVVTKEEHLKLLELDDLLDIPEGSNFVELHELCTSEGFHLEAIYAK